MDFESLKLRAQSYLDSNYALRDAIGIAHGVPLLLHYLAEGEHNRNFQFADPVTEKQYVLRVNLTMQPFHSDQVSYEFNALRNLAPSKCTPLVYYCDSSANAPGHGVIVMDFCKGHTLNFDRLRSNDLSDVASIMANVHSISPASHCNIYRPKDQLKELLMECMRNFDIYKGSQAQNDHITENVLEFIDICRRDTKKYFASNEPEYANHILNAEPLASHFLIGAANVEKSEVDTPGFFIDWERPIIGEVAQDLGYFLAPTSTFWDSETLISKNQTEAFLDMYWNAVDNRFAKGPFEERFIVYRRIAILRAICWCCKALTRMLPNSTAHITQKAKDKVGIYLSDEFLDSMYKEYFMT